MFFAKHTIMHMQYPPFIDLILIQICAQVSKLFDKVMMSWRVSTNL